MKIWVDNDACPHDIKDIIFRASERRGVPVVLVANRPMRPPPYALVTCLTAPAGADEADKMIAAQVAPGDLVITADIPLADAVVTAAGVAINPKGEVYTAANIKEKLAMRDFMTQMRNDGMLGYQSGKSFGKNERQRFADAFDRELTRQITQQK